MRKSNVALFLVFIVALIGIAPSISLAEVPSSYVVLKGRYGDGPARINPQSRRCAA